MAAYLARRFAASQMTISMATVMMLCRSVMTGQQQRQTTRGADPISVAAILLTRPLPDPPHGTFWGQQTEPASTTQTRTSQS